MHWHSSLVWYGGGVSCKQQTTDPQILVVNFDSDGGSEVTKQEVKVGDKATEPENPTKEGYTFVAWKNGEEVYDFEKEVTSNLNLKAEWKAVENTGDSGSTGGDSGSTGGESGSTGGESGSTGGESGSTGGDSGSTGGESGSTGGESGSTGGESGSTGGESGSTGGESGTGDTGKPGAELPNVFSLNQDYSGNVTYTWKKSDDGKQVFGEKYFDVDVSGVTIKEKDSLKISFEATGLPNDGIIVCQSPVENWGWHAENKKENNTYSFNIKALNLNEIKENKITLKIVPGSSDTSLDGQNIKLTFNNLKVVYEEYVDNGIIAQNENAFTKAYDGFVYKFPKPVDISEKTKIVIEVEFLDANKEKIEMAWGLGQTLVLEEGETDWSKKLCEQYNLGKQDVDLTKIEDKTKKVGSLVFQNSKEDVKFIIIKNISFE